MFAKLLYVVAVVLSVRIAEAVAGDCFTQQLASLPGANGQQNVWKNAGGCSCKDARDQVLQKKQQIGGYAPQCDDSGKFSLTQSWGSTGSSWCADPATGHQISQVQGRGAPGQNCVMILASANSNGAGAASGSLQGSNKAASGGDCFTQQLASLPGANGQQNVWKNAGGCSCKDARNQVLQKKQQIGGYAPQCDDSGKFSLTQSWGSTGSSWCADPATGHQISQVQGRGAPGQNCVMILASANSNGAAPGNVAVPGGSKSRTASDCFSIQSVTLPGGNGLQSAWKNVGACSCQKARDQVLQKNQLVGGYAPQCDDSGKFKLTQSWGSTGSSWCADPATGHQISQSQGPGAPGQNCVLILSNANQNIVGPLKSPVSGGSQSSGSGLCLTQQQIDLPGASRQQFGWHNSGGCSCKDARDRLSQSLRVGGYVPQCDDSGKFSLTQRWGSTGSSWCADPATGHQISQTAGRSDPGLNCVMILAGANANGVAPGSAAALSGSNAANVDSCFLQQTIPLPGANAQQIIGWWNYKGCSCQDARNRVSQSQQIGGYVPQCDNSGKFSLTQSWGSTGSSWCADPVTGHQISQTQGPGAPGQNCVMIAANAAKSSGLPGSGSASGSDCFSLKPVTWPGANGPDNAWHNDGGCSCADARNQHQQTAVVSSGGYKPDCDDSGKFKLSQFSGSTGYSWCADPATGNQISQSQPPGSPGQNCAMILAGANSNGAAAGPSESSSASNADCFTQKLVTLPGSSEQQNAWQNTGGCLCNDARSKVLQNTQQLGAYAPQCDDSGKFSLTQSWGSTGSSWCADPATGHQISQTQGLDAPGQNCAMIAANAGSSGTDSAANGGSGGDCFTQQLVTLPGANGPENAWKNSGGCSCKDAQDRVQQSSSIGGYTPQCDDAGKFSLTQSWGSTGSSWCADPATGHQISPSQGPGTPGQNCAMIAANANSSGSAHGSDCFSLKSVTWPGANGPDNSWHNDGGCSCADARNQVLQKTDIDGSYAPQCDDSGKFSLTQNWGSTGGSWCADPATGHQISQSQGPGSPGQNCAMVLAGADNNGAAPASSTAASGGACFTQQLVSLPGADGQQNAWHNSGGCSCKDAQNQLEQNGLIGGYTPQCDDAGKFSLTQSWGSTGSSWCADPATGHQISQSQGPGSPGQNCVMALASANSNGAASGGAADSASSTGASGGACFTQQLVSLPGADGQQNAWHNSGGCSCKDAQNQLEQGGLNGGYTPQCDDAGKFSLTQSWGSTGSSWCADPATGHQISQTQGPGAPGQNCIMIAANANSSGSASGSDCFSLKPATWPGANGQDNAWHNDGGCSCADARNQHQQTAVVTSVGYQPDCDDSGKFKLSQFSGSTGYSWCADPATGNQISQSQPPGSPGQNCAMILAGANSNGAAPGAAAAPGAGSF